MTPKLSPSSAWATFDFPPAVFANGKVKLIRVDVNQHSVDAIKRGKIHIGEPSWDMVRQDAVSQEHLCARSSIHDCG
jgi:UDP-N-acetyl-D-mannosaminuronate dehydrogenase